MKKVVLCVVAVLLLCSVGMAQTPNQSSRPSQLVCRPLDKDNTFIYPNESVIGNQACHVEPLKPAPAPDPAPAPAQTAAPTPTPAQTPAPAVQEPAPVTPTLSGVHRKIVLEDNTPVHLVLSQNLSSASATTGQTISFEVSEDVIVDGLLVIPRGSIAWGTVTDAKPKGHMGKAGHLDVNIDKVRLADGEKVLLSATSHAKGGTHTAAMTAGIVATSLVVWPAAPFFLFMHGHDITIPKGTKIEAFTNGNASLDAANFAVAPK
jgi:hypothetical protein